MMRGLKHGQGVKVMLQECEVSVCRGEGREPEQHALIVPLLAWQSQKPLHTAPPVHIFLHTHEKKKPKTKVQYVQKLHATTQPAQLPYSIYRVESCAR